jgi:hypothetical protein
VIQNRTEHLNLNRSVSFDPAVGFTLSDLPDPYGNYECVVGDKEDNDMIEFDVIPDKGNSKKDSSILKSEDLKTKQSLRCMSKCLFILDAKPEFDYKLWKNATFKFITNKLAFECCSSTAKPPKLALQLCNHPTLCKLRKHNLHNVSLRDNPIGNNPIRMIKYKAVS